MGALRRAGMGVGAAGVARGWTVCRVASSASAVGPEGADHPVTGRLRAAPAARAGAPSPNALQDEVDGLGDPGAGRRSRACSKWFAVRPGSDEFQDAALDGSLFVVDEKPVRSDVTFPDPLVLSGQRMVAMPLVEWAVVHQFRDHVAHLGPVMAARARTRFLSRLN